MKTFLKILKLVGAAGLVCYDIALICAAANHQNGGWLDRTVLTATGLYILLAIFSFAQNTIKKVIGAALLGLSGLNILLRIVSLAASIVLNGAVMGNSDFAAQLMLYYGASTVFAAAVFLCGMTAFKPHFYKAAGIVFALSFAAAFVFYVWTFVSSGMSATDWTGYLLLLDVDGYELLPPSAMLCASAVFIDGAHLPRS